jgi:hypothetical protein
MVWIFGKVTILEFMCAEMLPVKTGDFSFEFSGDILPYLIQHSVVVT